MYDYFSLLVQFTCMIIAVITLCYMIFHNKSNIIFYLYKIKNNRLNFSLS